MSTLEQRAAAIELLALDVDGVLSDGRLHYSSDGLESKAFFTADGLGIKMLQSAGVEVAIITGRSSPMVDRRAAELGIVHVIQGREDKLQALQTLLNQIGLELPNVAYMGDDLPDLAAICAAGVGMTVADGDATVAAHADWRSRRGGGRGAVREACEMILQARGQLEAIHERFKQGQAL